MSELPPLRDVIARHELGAKKALGQHFLLDLNITRKIARAAEIVPGDLVLEIGPGPGGLTRALLQAGARVIAVERDERCIDALMELDGFYPGMLQVEAGDALEIDERALQQITLDGLAPSPRSRSEGGKPGARTGAANEDDRDDCNGLNKSGALTPAPLPSGEGKLKIVANLPYNISTELLVKWLRLNGEKPLWSRMALMFQKEVADRILAAPGSKAYGRLSVISQAASAPERAFDLPARAFTPPPKVESSVVVFAPRAAAADCLHALERTTAAAFGQRRKMLRSSLKPLFGERVEQELFAIDIDPTDRAENLSVADFLRLARRAQGSGFAGATA